MLKSLSLPAGQGKRWPREARSGPSCFNSRGGRNELLQLKHPPVSPHTPKHMSTSIQRPGLFLFTLCTLSIPSALRPSPTLAADMQSTAQPTLAVELGPWESDTLQESLWMRISPMVRRGTGQGDQYKLEMRPLAANRRGALVTIVDTHQHRYSVEIRIDDNASAEQASRVFSTTIANVLEGVLSGEATPGTSSIPAEPNETVNVENGADQFQEDSRSDFQEQPSEAAPTTLKKRRRKAASPSKRDARPNSFALQPAPGFAFSIGTLPFDSGAVMFAPSQSYRVAALELGLGASLTRTLEFDARFMFSERSDADLFATRMRGQLGLGLTPGWRDLQFPLAATVDLDYWEWTARSLETSPGVRPSQTFDAENMAAAVGARVGIRRTWSRPGKRWKTSLGMDIAVRFPMAFTEYPKQVGNSYRGDLTDKPHPAATLDLNTWTGELALSLRFGRWREPAN